MNKIFFLILALMVMLTSATANAQMGQWAQQHKQNVQLEAERDRQAQELQQVKEQHAPGIAKKYSLQLLQKLLITTSQGRIAFPVDESYGNQDSLLVSWSGKRITVFLHNKDQGYSSTPNLLFEKIDKNRYRFLSMKGTPTAADAQRPRRALEGLK